jgi:hypothetical protein
MQRASQERRRCIIDKICWPAVTPADHGYYILDEYLQPVASVLQGYEFLLVKPRSISIVVLKEGT